MLFVVPAGNSSTRDTLKSRQESHSSRCHRSTLRSSCQELLLRPSNGGQVAASPRSAAHMIVATDTEDWTNRQRYLIPKLIRKTTCIFAHARAHTHTHARAHTPTHTRTHTHDGDDGDGNGDDEHARTLIHTHAHTHTFFLGMMGLVGWLCVCVCARVCVSV